MEGIGSGRLTLCGSWISELSENMSYLLGFVPFFFEHWFGEDGGGLKVEWDVKNDAQVKRGVSWKRELKQKKKWEEGEIVS